jgi:hypothetical protein
MRLRWTTPASQDLYNIVRRIQEDNPSAAAKVASTLTMDVGFWRISLVAVVEGGLREPANWSSLACRISLFIGFKTEAWKSCASTMEHKTGLETQAFKLTHAAYP